MLAASDSPKGPGYRLRLSGRRSPADRPVLAGTHLFATPGRQRRRAGRQRDRGCGGVSIVNSWKQALAERWMVLSQRPLLQLLRLFAERMLHGGGELGADDLDLGMGVVLILLAMPGVLVSLLMFEKFGSLIRFLRGDGVFDPYIATVPDEYFFIVLSMAVSCAATLWRLNSIFFVQPDHLPLVSLPISLATIFLANVSEFIPP